MSMENPFASASAPEHPKPENGDVTFAREKERLLQAFRHDHGFREALAEIQRSPDLPRLSQDPEVRDAVKRQALILMGRNDVALGFEVAMTFELTDDELEGLGETAAIDLLRAGVVPKTVMKEFALPDDFIQRPKSQEAAKASICENLRRGEVVRAKTFAKETGVDEAFFHSEAAIKATQDCIRSIIFQNRNTQNIHVIAKAMDLKQTDKNDAVEQGVLDWLRSDSRDVRNADSIISNVRKDLAPRRFFQSPEFLDAVRTAIKTQLRHGYDYEAERLAERFNVDLTEMETSAAKKK